MNDYAPSGAAAGKAPSSPGLHRFAVFLVFAVLVLITAGALVKSKEAGLSVPDWPLSFGSVNPPGWYHMDGVRFEHGHRLIASTVGLLTVILAIWLQRRERRPALRRLGWLAVGAVVAQGILGGLTVLFGLPPLVSISHAALAQLFLCLTVTIAVTTSRRWWSGEGEQRPLAAVGKLKVVAIAATAMIFLQILLGALVRHYGAGMAIPDFPLSFGRVVPMQFDFKIGLQYAHRVLAMLVGLKVLSVSARVFARYRSEPSLLWPAALMAVLVVTQILLGASIIWTARAVVPNSLHVATGASLLATSLILSLHSSRFARAARGGAR